MSYSTELSDDCMGIHHVGSGAVAGEEILEACRATTQLLQNTENFHYEFIDFSEVTELTISEDEFDRMIAQDFYAAIYRPDAVVVIVAPRDDLFAIATKWEQRIKGIGWQTHIARDRTEAKAWLLEHYPNPSAPREPATDAETELSAAPGDPSTLA